MPGGAAAVRGGNSRGDDGGGGGGGGGADGFGRRRTAELGGFGASSGRCGGGGEGERYEGGVQIVRNGGKRLHYAQEPAADAQPIGRAPERRSVRRHDRDLRSQRRRSSHFRRVSGHDDAALRGGMSYRSVALWLICM